VNMRNVSSRIRDRGFQGELKLAEPLCRHLSLKTGGPAALFAEPDTLEDVTVLLACLEEESVPWVILGGGTNTVFTNGGYRGCVVRLGRQFTGLQVEEDSILLSGAALALASVVESAAQRGLSGMESLAGIPGTIGGAVFMNAGTRNGNIADVIREVRLFDGKASRWEPSERLGFSYRSSRIPEGNIILDARLQLTPSSSKEVRSRMKVWIEQRKKTQPSGLPSAGCWFRNPAGDSAGRLIDEAGMKGESFGRAQVSEVHANFLVNLGGASTSDFLGLARKVRKRVHERFGVMLQEEVTIIDG